MKAELTMKGKPLNTANRSLQNKSNECIMEMMRNTDNHKMIAGMGRNVSHIDRLVELLLSSESDSVKANLDNLMKEIKDNRTERIIVVEDPVELKDVASEKYAITVLPKNL